MNYWDLLSCLGFLLLAMTALLSRHWLRRTSRVELHTELVILAACTVLFLLMVVMLGQAPVPAVDEQISISVPRQDLAGEYASSTSCRSCHPGNYRSWHNSYHRSMTMVADPDGIRAPFDGRELQLGNTTFRVWQSDDEFWVTTPDPDREYALLKQNEFADSLEDFYHPRLGPAPPMVDRRVVMTTGSHKMQMYWLPSTVRDQELRLFPWVYFIPEKKWIPYEDSFIVDPRYSRPPATWTTNCIICHAVNGKPNVKFKLLQDDHELETSVSELGIACEACHGPAAEHVKLHSNPLTRYQSHLFDKPDSTIFNPAKASQQESADACGQCHSTFEPTSIQDFLEHGSSFRPGTPLAKTHQLVFYGDQSKETDTHHDAFWEDGSVRTGGREYLGMVISKCFTEGTMTCLDCHSMHDSLDPSDQLTRPAVSNESCLRCHEKFADSVAEHTHHEIGSEGSRCYNCHMPHTSFALMGAIRSHRVDSPSVANEVQNGRPNACNLCHLDKTLRWTSDSLQEWFGHKPPTLDKDQAQVASAVRWIIGGDAVQRAIGSWHMGWQPALTASGQDWQLPLLNILRTDDYSVNRFIANQSMQAHPVYQQLNGDIDYDFIGSPDQRGLVRDEFLKRWIDSRLPRTIPPAVMLGTDGVPKMENIKLLIEGRNNRPIMVAE